MFHQVVLLIRTYAFYNRNSYLFFGLCSGLAVVIVYQLFVTINEMIRKHTFLCDRKTGVLTNFQSSPLLRRLS